MTAERVDPPRRRRRRNDVAEAGTEVPAADPVPLQRTLTGVRTPTAGGTWVGRASKHRRAQVRARGPELEPEGPTGPVASTRPQPTTAKQEPIVDTALLEQHWPPVVDRLKSELENLSSVLLCTAGGTPLAVYGLPDADVPATARLTGALFGAGHDLTAARAGADPIETMKLTAGQTHTVIAMVSMTDGDHHLLSVVAEGASLGVMLLRTRQAVESLRESLSGAADE